MEENISSNHEIRCSGYDKIPIAISESFTLEDGGGKWRYQFLHDSKEVGSEIRHTVPMYVEDDDRRRRLTKVLKQVLTYAVYKNEEIDSKDVKHEAEAIVADLEIIASSPEHKQRTYELVSNLVSINSESSGNTFLNAKIPVDYRVSHAVFKIHSDMSLKKICNTPCAITGIAINLDGHEPSLKLSYTGASGTEQSIWISKSQMFNHMKDGLYSELATTTISTPTGGMGPLTGYLDDQYTINKHDFDSNACLIADSNGWKENCSCFVFADKMYCEDGIKDIIAKKHVKGLAKRGELAQWVSAVKPLFKYPRVRFSCYAAMAAILLRLLGVTSFALDMYGESGTGKTLSQKIAISHIGNPKDLMRNADTSIAAFTNLASGFTDLPLLLDENELKDAGKNKQRAGDDKQRLIYMIYEEKSPSRAMKDGRSRPDKEWKTVVLCNGEHPVLSDSANAGAKARCISTNGGIHRNENEMPSKEIMGAAMTAIENSSYGHIFELFIQRVFKYKSQLKQLYEESQKLFDSVEGAQHNRLIPMYGIILLAGQLLEEIYAEIGIETADHVKICQDIYRETVISNPVIPQWKTALLKLRDWIAENHKCFTDEGLKNFGHVTTLSSNQYYIDIIPAVLQKFLEDSGISYKQALGKWREMGIVDTNNDNTFQKTRRIDGQSRGFTSINCLRADEILESGQSIDGLSFYTLALKGRNLKREKIFEEVLAKANSRDYASYGEQGKFAIGTNNW